MKEPTITCPSCKADIKLTEAVAGPIITQVEQKYKAILDGNELAAKDQRERDKREIQKQEAEKAKQLVASELETSKQQIKDLTSSITTLTNKLTEAQSAQTEYLRKSRALEDQQRELNLTIETRVSESINSIRQKAKEEAENSIGLRVTEKEEIISSMQREIESLKRKSEQGSQQMQGEAQEIVLESRLQQEFPSDTIEPVAKGVYGADVLHRVIDSKGTVCGTIIWESKRTKNWKDEWLSKLRSDQLHAKADIAIIVTQALPEGVKTFDLIDGVWVCDFQHGIALALSLRYTLLELNKARIVGEGQQTKMEIIYQYLTGGRFKGRIQAMIEKITDMGADLEKERKAMTRLWAKREEQIRLFIESTAGLYGDLQGIAGSSLPEIENMTLLLPTNDPI